MAERERVSIEVSASGVRTVRRDLESLGQSADRTEDAVTTLRRALGALSGALIARELYEMVEQFTVLQNRLRSLTPSGDQAVLMFGRLVDVANRTRTSLEATVTMYQRVSMASGVLGINAAETASFVETLNKAVIVSGASAREANAALIQLSQGISSNNLGGEELRSVLEQLPYVADVIAREMGVSRGQLRELGSQAKITGDVIIRAFNNASEEIQAKFLTTLPTMAQGLQLVRDSFMNYIGELDQSLGTSRLFANLLLDISRNMEQIGAVALGLGASVATAFVPATLRLFNAQLLRMNALIAANPIGALLTATVGLTTYLALMRNELDLGVDSVTKLGDLTDVVWTDAKEGASDLADALAQQVAPGIDSITDKLSKITFIDVMRVLADEIDEIRRMWGGLVAVLETMWAKFAEGLGPRLVEQLNPVLEQLSDLANWEPPWFKYARSAMGKGPKDTFDFTIDPVNQERSAIAGRTVDEAYRSGYNLTSTMPGTRDYLDRAEGQAKVNAQFRTFTEIADLVTRKEEKVTKAKIDDTKAAKELEKALKKASQTYQELNKAVNPDGVAKAEYEERLQAVNLLLKHNKISQLEYNAAIGNAAMEYVKSTQAGKRYAETVRYVATQQEALKQAQREADLDVASVGQGTLVTEQANRVNQIRQDFIRQRFDLERDFADKSNQMTEQEYDDKMAIIRRFEEANVAVVQDSFERQLMAQQDWKNGVTAAFQDYYDNARNIAQQTQQAFTNAFNGLEDALVNFVKTGKLSFSDFADSVISDLTRIAVRQATTSVLADVGLSTMFGTPVQGGFTSALQTGAGYASGGYTGPGGVHEYAGPVHKGEYVFNQDAVNRIGLGNLERMHRGEQTGTGGGQVVYSPTYSVQMSGGGSEQDRQDMERRLQELGEEDQSRFRQFLLQEKEVGGILNDG